MGCSNSFNADPASRVDFISGVRNAFVAATQRGRSQLLVWVDVRLLEYAQVRQAEWRVLTSMRISRSPNHSFEPLAPVSSDVNQRKLE